MAACRQACHHRYGNSHATGDHTVLPATRGNVQLALLNGYKPKNIRYRCIVNRSHPVKTGIELCLYPAQHQTNEIIVTWRRNARQH